ncbi:hypothetical protein [Sphingomonas sp.]|uniref:hypothetical protein n=1 Tax=Sphingomonas sp. TaxID=28214 RepID=UPI0035BC401F
MTDTARGIAEAGPRRHPTNVVLLAVVAWVSGVSAAPPPVLVVPADGAFAGSVNGSPVRVLMTADGLSYPVLNPDVAGRLSLKSSMFTVEARVGAVTIPGRTGVVTLGIGRSVEKRRALWFERPSVGNADVALGPESVPHTVVTFLMRPEVSGERRIGLPMTRKGGRLGTIVQVGQASVFVQWNLQRVDSLATAAAANDLAATNGAKLEGAPRTEIIRFGVARPVRSLRLAAPLVIGPVRVAAMNARISDYGNAGGIPDADADPNEVVVYGKRKDRSEHVLTIGRGDLSRCSSISFDKAAKRINLTCAG